MLLIATTKIKKARASLQSRLLTSACIPYSDCPTYIISSIVSLKVFIILLVIIVIVLWISELALIILILLLVVLVPVTPPITSSSRPALSLILALLSLHPLGILSLLFNPLIKALERILLLLSSTIRLILVVSLAICTSPRFFLITLLLLIILLFGVVIPVPWRAPPIIIRPSTWVTEPAPGALCFVPSWRIPSKWVVLTSLCLVWQNTIGTGYFFELIRRLPLIRIWMILLRVLIICFFNFLVCRVLRHSHDFVIILRYVELRWSLAKKASSGDPSINHCNKSHHMVRVESRVKEEIREGLGSCMELSAVHYFK